MSIEPLHLTAELSSITRTLARAADTNQDGNISANEFEQFLRRFVASLTGSSIGAISSSAPRITAPTSLLSLQAPAAGGERPYLDHMPGFNAERFDEGGTSIKYRAGNLLAQLDPTDPDAMKKAYDQLIGEGREVRFDPEHENLLLDEAGGEGYIGRRLSDRGNPNSPLVWQWMAYNDVVRGPNGETT
jgi:hypothetical protein